MANVLDQTRIHELLDRVGQLLRERGEAVEVVAIGGATLLLLGFIKRATNDVDVIGTVENDSVVALDALPAPLAHAVADIADLEGVSPDWVNTQASSVVSQGLPVGFLSRCVRREFGGLVLRLVGRKDQLWLKLHAAADRGIPTGKHVRDLQALAPTREELLEAAQVCRDHDPSEGFAAVLAQVLAHFGVSDEP